ncbi:uncharacterized protein C11orf97 homolog isoform X1 [Ahaetulla prasina]|uniref:uncharacterized protein C11orf97 homolog isoform X1 n=1 Tax=Ahaetulla prasina TaxID=499056 RepID=UPI0026493577|nr:uncharacterized protein C11orf97 homolog isoform X1 [Ahaetulla prasina]
MATSLRVPLAWARLAGASRSSRRGRDMRASTGESPETKAGDSGSRIYGESNDGGQPSIMMSHPSWDVQRRATKMIEGMETRGKKFVYVEPPRRVREVLEEELYFQRDECRMRHPSEVALERIWSLKRNFPVGAFNPASQNQSCFLSQPYYSRHAVIRR